jgi:hypothetical protein
MVAIPGKYANITAMWTGQNPPLGTLPNHPTGHPVPIAAHPAKTPMPHIDALRYHYVMRVDAAVCRRLIGDEIDAEQVILIAFAHDLKELHPGKKMKGYYIFGYPSVFPRLRSFPDREIFARHENDLAIHFGDLRVVLGPFSDDTVEFSLAIDDDEYSGTLVLVVNEAGEL